MIDRYKVEEIRNIFSDESKFNKFLKVELSVLHGYVKEGIVPLKDYQAILNKAYIDIKKIEKLEKATHHDVIAFTRSITEMLGDEGKWFHYGLTSTDVVDTSWSLMIKEANIYLLSLLNNLKDVLINKANKYKYTKIIGRTHGMHAEITSFGLKYLNYLDELNRDILRFEREKETLEVAKLSGAVGNYVNIPLSVALTVSNELELPLAVVSTQVLSRDRHAGYIMSLSLIASLLDKMAVEFRNLSRTEINEVSEAFDTGQKGSSTMPHKKNPIGFENISGCSRIIESYVSVALSNNPLYHERDISHSSSERIMIPDAIELLCYMLKRITNLINNLVVDEEKMIKNIHSTFDVVFSSSVLHALIYKGMLRDKAYDLVQKLSFEAMDKRISLKELLRDKEILTEEELEKAFDMNHYLSSVDEIYKKAGL